MGLPKTLTYHLPLHLPLITVVGFLAMATPTTASDFTTLVFKGCANQKLQDPSGIFSQNLKTLMDSLLQQSSQKGFYTTTSGDGQDAITGLYQCRGDLSTTQCSKCISKIPDMVKSLCGAVVAARVQLSGCYLRYEIAGFKQEPGTQFLYKVCGSGGGGGGLEARRKTALGMVVSGVKNGGGFYTGSYQSVYVLGQCDGDLSSGDCGDCLESAVETVEKVCGDSISAQVYLNKCFVSYSYYPNGVPNIASPSGEEGPKQHTQRTVAIAVGGVAAVGFLIVFLLFLKSLLRKRRDY